MGHCGTGAVQEHNEDFLQGCALHIFSLRHHEIGHFPKPHHLVQRGDGLERTLGHCHAGGKQERHGGQERSIP